MARLFPGRRAAADRDPVDEPASARSSWRTFGLAQRAAVALLAAVVVVGVFVLVTALVVRRPTAGSGAQRAGLPSAGQAAVDAARQEALNLISYSQANFAADFQRSLDGTTGDLKSQLAASKTATQQAITKGKFDLTGQITAAGLVSLDGTTATVLVSSDGYQKSGSKSTLVAHNRLQLTMVEVGGTWLISNLSSVGLI